MSVKCSFLEILMLYIFSICYVLKQYLGKLVGIYRGLNGRLFVKCQNHICIITGGTSGIGLETAKRLLSFGMHVIIGSPDSEHAKSECLRKIKEAFPEAKVDIWHLDLSSMTSVKKFALKFLETNLPLHVLINNAGIMFAPSTLTEDGFESHFAINYLSHSLLTKLLLPRLRVTGSGGRYARIINVTSCVHYLAKADFQNVRNIQAYCPHHNYLQSKLFQVMFTHSLNHFLKTGNCPVTVNCVHPGIVNTQLYKYVWWAPYLGPLILKTPAQGAETSVYVALSAELEKIGGMYFEECKRRIPSKCSRDTELQNRLWNTTWKLLKPWLEETKME